MGAQEIHQNWFIAILDILFEENLHKKNIPS
jgi:hypothetical protein